MPRLQRHSSIIAADKVLTKLKQMWQQHGVSDGIIRHYANRREQGYHISCGQHSVSFAEHRSSDQIIVTWGPTQAYDGAGLLCDRLWDTNKFMVWPHKRLPNGKYSYDIDETLVASIINCLNYGHPEGVHPLQALAQEAE